MRHLILRLSFSACFKRISAKHHTTVKLSTMEKLRHFQNFTCFPRDIELKNKWTKFCKRKRDWIPTRTSTICSIHFLETQFQCLPNKRRKLIDGAMPTVLLSDTENENEIVKAGTSQCESCLNKSNAIVTSNELTPREKRLEQKIGLQAKKIKRLQSKTRFLEKKVATLKDTLKKINEKSLKDEERKLKCKPDWCLPSTSKETDELLRQCTTMQPIEPDANIEELIQKSKAFPIPFPIESVRLESLKERRPVDRLQRNIVSTYPIVHERVLLLMTHFLIYKREFGSSIEKAFYKDMSVPELIDRLLTKRAVSFMGPHDLYLLLSGERGQKEQWESVGTMSQREPLVLSNCLSYDEMKISAMLYVSSHTECINNGERHNGGVVDDDDVEHNAVIIGVIGPRFERTSRMEYEDILITEAQNCPENGYGEEVTPTTCLNVLKTTYVRNNQSAKHMWRQMWSEFYQVPSYTYEELSSYVNTEAKSDERRYTDRFVSVERNSAILDNEAYYKRICIIAESVLLEAQERAEKARTNAFLNVIGAGLGVWKVSPHQSDVYVLTLVERTRALLRRDALAHVTDLNFAFIHVTDGIKAFFTHSSQGNSENAEMRIFLESKKHPKGGINVQISNREPSARLTGEHAGKLLVMTYPWDGNAHPGNEFWLGSLDGSGDPAAACSTQIAELHNAHINPHVCARNTRVVATTNGLGVQPLTHYCASVLE